MQGNLERIFEAAGNSLRNYRMN